jgi:UDP-2,3-diacylglucosamine pyrophosphatase LpxH
MVFGNGLIKKEVVHVTADGRRFLVMHGDQFDAVVKFSPILAIIGTKLYNWLLWNNRIVNLIRRKMGFSHWSLASFMKHKVKNAVHYISKFETVVACKAARRGVDGSICGHMQAAA